jgi:3-phosphoshikimate 1-carboxyvinyltransferase
MNYEKEKLNINKNKEHHLELNLNGSKSISNRVILIASFIQDISYIYNIPKNSEDVMLMINAVKKLGIKFEKISEQSNVVNYKILGKSINNINAKADLYCGNSGTTLRFLTGMLAFSNGEYILRGDHRMHERPIEDLVDTLINIGVRIEYLNNYGYPPIKIVGNSNIKKDLIEINTDISSQFISAILMGIINLKNNLNKKIITTKNIISKPYIDMTIFILKKFGINIINMYSGINYYKVIDLQPTGIDYVIEPDASSASYFLAIASINGSCRINNLNNQSIQGDKNFIKILKKMGAKVEINDNFIKVEKYKPLKAISIDMTNMPDVAMTLAVLALFAKGTTHISGIASWKIKETDRIKALYNELIKFKAKVLITNDSITITPFKNFNHEIIEIDTYNDHRIAMCFSIMAFSENKIIIKNPNCVNKTFGNYFNLFNQLYN